MLEVKSPQQPRLCSRVIGDDLFDNSVTYANLSTSARPPRRDSDAISSIGAAELARAIASGEVSAVEALDSALRRIDETDGMTNAVAVPLYEQARRQARLADDAAVRARRRAATLGPLHGVPVSVKECFFVTGTDATMGCDRFAGRPTQSDSPLVRRLRHAGGILVAKTNVQQAMMLHESTNPLYGRTSHPSSALRSPGGSSGGEAALVAQGGSALGLGTDLGGSIRQPAHACGLAGLKPTQGRLSIRGCRSNLPSPGVVSLVPGPLARRVEDLALAMNVMTNKTHVGHQHDEVSLAWQSPASICWEGRRVAYWTDDGYFTPSPAIRRAVDESCEALRRRGAVVEAIAPPDISRLMELYLGVLTADGMRFAEDAVSPGRRDRFVGQQILLSKLPGPARWLLSQVLAAGGQRELSKIVGWCGQRSMNAYAGLTRAAIEYRDAWLDQMEQSNYDLLLMPPHGLPAMRHGEAFDSVSAASYCFFANLLDLPAGVVPVTRVGNGEECDRTPSRDRVQRSAIASEADSSGLPIGVQAVARPWREDLVLSAMQAIEEDAAYS